jgi:hypothetical protein
MALISFLHRGSPALAPNHGGQRIHASLVRRGRPHGPLIFMDDRVRSRAQLVDSNGCRYFLCWQACQSGSNMLRFTCTYNLATTPPIWLSTESRLMYRGIGDMASKQNRPINSSLHTLGFKQPILCGSLHDKILILCHHMFVLPFHYRNSTRFHEKGAYVVLCSMWIEPKNNILEIHVHSYSIIVW